MNLLPNEEIQEKALFNFAPMMDFLFLMMALFAVLAISRSSILDTNINLYENGRSSTQVASQETANISIVVNPLGEYKWISELNEYSLEDINKVQAEIIRRYELGLLPKNKQDTKILLHIDKNAPWQKIADLLFAIREIGFHPYPVYKSS